MNEKSINGDRIIEVLTNRSAMRIANSDKEVAFLIAENDQLRKENEALREENKLLRGEKDETKK